MKLVENNKSSAPMEQILAKLEQYESINEDPEKLAQQIEQLKQKNIELSNSLFNANYELSHVYSRNYNKYY